VTAVVRTQGLGVRTAGSVLLDDIDLEVRRGRHLALLGPNGAGKTTLLRVLSTYRFPSRGSVEVLGATFGQVDLRTLRPRIGFVSVGLDPLLQGSSRVAEVVAAARDGVLLPLRSTTGDARAPVDDAGTEAVGQALERMGVAPLGDRRLHTLSQGERQRVRIARALAVEPELLLLDEPFAGLDLGGRESLLADLDRLLAEADGPTVLLVTHHLEELPTGLERVALLRAGRLVAEGPPTAVLTDEALSATFGLRVEATHHAGRWAARGIVG
jgi:iron complex transport system ATP-binding protein